MTSEKTPETPVVLKPEAETLQQARPSKLLNFAEIEASSDLAFEDVDVPEWGGQIRIQGLSGNAATEFVDAQTKDNQKEAAYKIVWMTAITEDGSRVFGADEKKAIAFLKTKSFKVILRLQQAALRVNGLADDEKAVTKND